MKYAITPLTKPVTTEIEIPGSKSLTNRALILAAQTKEEVKILNPLIADDTKSMIECLQTLGIEIKFSEDSIYVFGDITKVEDKEYELNAHLSGTTIRFILALSCITKGTKKIYGEGGLKKRPIKQLVEALRELGADIEYLENEGFPPVLVKSSTLQPGTINLRGDISSQFISALLLITPTVGNIDIQITGEQISKPYIEMTRDLLKNFGQHEYFIEGDYSSAAYFFSIAKLTGSTFKFKNLNPDSKQADLEFVKILEEMGNEIKPINIDMTNCPDQIQTMAVLLSFAHGQSEITGIKSLRIKETDRVKALENELSKMGITTESTENTLKIFGGNPKEAEIETYKDHRMAMSFAIAGCKIPSVIIKDPKVVSKTYPNFWDDLRRVTEVKEIES